MPERFLKILIPPAFCLAIITGYFLWANRNYTVTRSFFAMGTAFEITASGNDPDRAVEAAFNEIQRIENLTGYVADSDIQKINRQAGIRPVIASAETLELLKIVDSHYQDLSGTFDPSIAPLVDLWGFEADSMPRLPGNAAIEKAKSLVNFKNVQINYRSKTVFLSQPGMKLDLGGIAKGYAVDRAYTVLRKHGITSALINGGSSSIRVIGTKKLSTPWNLGIGHPRRHGKLLGTLCLTKDRALGTSADTQNYFIENGVRYSHLINPATGYPSRKMLITAIAPTAVEADLLSTAFFILPTAKIRSYIQKHPKIGAVIVDSHGHLIVFNEPGFAN